MGQVSSPFCATKAKFQQDNAQPLERNLPFGGNPVKDARHSILARVTVLASSSSDKRAVPALSSKWEWAKRSPLYTARMGRVFFAPCRQNTNRRISSYAIRGRHTLHGSTPRKTFLLTVLNGRLDRRLKTGSRRFARVSPAAPLRARQLGSDRRGLFIRCKRRSKACGGRPSPTAPRARRCASVAYPKRSAQMKTGDWRVARRAAFQFRGHRLLFKFFGHDRKSQLGLCQ